MSHRSRFPLTALAALFAAGQVCASGVPALKEVIVTAKKGSLLGIADSATEGTVGAEQIATRPLLRAAELFDGPVPADRPEQRTPGVESHAGQGVADGPV